MKRRARLLRNAGRAGLAVFLVIVVAVVLFRRIEQTASDVPVIRFAHMLVYDRARDVLDELIADYEARQRAAGTPVRVEQIVFPTRMKRPWVRTQLVGGTPPDLLQQEPMEVDSLLVSRYFRALSEDLDGPNPYNAGTSLEGVPWRNTFYDGLEQTGFDFRLSQNFGIPLFGQTMRIVLNTALWAEVAGASRENPPPAPTTFREFLRTPEAVARYRAATGKPLLTLAGFDEATRLLVQLLHEHQTQRLALQINAQGEMWTDRPAQLLAVLKGERPFPTVAEKSAYALIRRIGALLAPGSVTQSRDDAFFRFSQGQALMLVVTAMDAPALAATIGDAFPVEVFPVPLPPNDDPEFGSHAIGPVNERQFRPGGTFVVVRHADETRMQRALDFLRFLTSAPAAQRLSDATGMVPSMIGVEASPEVRPFLPLVEGYPPGVPLGTTIDQRRIYETNLEQLLRPEGGVEAYVAAIAPAMLAQFPRDLRDRRGQDVVLQLQDTLQAAAFFGTAPAGQRADERLDELLEVTLWYEWEAAFTVSQLDELERSPR